MSFKVAGGLVITVVTPVSITRQESSGLTTALLAAAGVRNEIQQRRDNSRNRRNALYRWRRAGWILAWRGRLEWVLLGSGGSRSSGQVAPVSRMSAGESWCGPCAAPFLVGRHVSLFTGQRTFLPAIQAE